MAPFPSPHSGHGLDFLKTEFDPAAGGPLIHQRRDEPWRSTRKRAAS